MNKKILTLVLCLIIFASLLGVMSACTEIGEIPVTAVVVEETEIFLSTSESSNTAQIKPTIYPADATNKKVVFSCGIQNYITVTSTGQITALKETEEPVEVYVSAAENDKISATVYVTVENVSATEVYFDPSTIEVYMGTQPFSVQPKFIPSHASVGTEITYSSTNESVLTVDNDGVVSIWGVGTAHVQANTFSGILGHLEIIVKYTPPMYTLTWSDSDAENFNQEPGVPRPINFFLIPMGENSDPSPKIIWSDGRRTIDASKDNGLICSYTPAENVTPGEYTITVTITDRDDQVLVLKSNPISIYSSLLTSGMTFINNGNYDIEYGDRISRTIKIADGQRPPEGYIWYYYEWDAERELYNGDGSNQDIYNFILTNKAKPTRTGGSGDFTQFATSSSSGDQQDFDGVLKADGTVFVYVVPIVAGETRYDLFCGDKTPYNVTASARSEIYDLQTTYQYATLGVMPKLTWSTLAGSKEYAVEITTIDNDGKEIETKYYYSDLENEASLFDGSSFTLPNTYSNTQQFVARVKTLGSGTAWSSPVTYDGVLVSSRLSAYYRQVSGVNFDRYLDDMDELGMLLNYLRVVRPTTSSVGLMYNANAAEGFSHTYTLEVAMSFSTETLQAGQGDGGLYESRKVIYMDGRAADTTNYSKILIASAEDSTPRDRIVQTIKVAYSAYGEAGTCNFRVDSADYVDADGVYYVTFELYVNAEDATLSTVTNEYNINILPKTAVGETTLSYQKGSGDKIDYFKGNEYEVEVSTSDQLYYVAQLGLKPVPKEGSAAATVYTAVKKVMDSIVSVDMSDRERVIAIYDWLVNNVYYDYNAANAADIRVNDAAFRLEGVFGIGTTGSRNIALCDGYAKAFTLMTWMADVPSKKVSGIVESGGHAWNIVFVEGEWTLVDATWGNTKKAFFAGSDIEVSSHVYLFCTDQMFEKDGHITYGYYPPASSVYGDYGYYRSEYVKAYGEKLDASDIIEYLLGTTNTKGVLDDVHSGQTVSLDIAIHSSAYTVFDEYFDQLIDALHLAGYTISLSVPIGEYGEVGNTTIIRKLYIKKS